MDPAIMAAIILGGATLIAAWITSARSSRRRDNSGDTGDRDNTKSNDQ